MKFSVISATILLASGLASAQELKANRLPEVRDLRQLDQIHDWLQKLEALGALDVSEDGKVHIKESIIDQLTREGRLSTEFSRTGSICE